ncbi:phage tail sheath family protein [Cellvibrio japonicus]|uniref:Phage tail sheath protein n=1 Tax=Cellvibrio japonicus (strain Ueda107) TaxID=498211 RepID=B3PD96_CELJU|nr:phage tail sheath subtilisin-like domain-containing protein [Cellvibrio japonicus]ACE86241.1 Phage tail sheath protein [Cellvibrio japonicus Ueda107]QEI13355.1 phage tail sheath family protein [Cellvibrio japonicus]QEI16929.1 phage tail sheath family protein [Cellvibrio japonicus]QEI20507.1 phage tail sheath family protein [Cellvibrio japonicus]
MPEYLAPGVFVEEVSYRAKSIEGVGTSVAGLVGPTRTGPLRGKPELLTSFADFVRVYGDARDLTLGTDTVLNHTAIAAKAFFDGGGSKLFVARIAGGTPEAATSADNDDLVFTARFPGAQSNYTLEVHWRSPVTGTDPTDFDLDVISNGEVIYTYSNISVAPTGPRSLGSVLAANPARRSDALSSPVSATVSADTEAEVVAALTALFDDDAASAEDNPLTGARYLIHLTGGSDGDAPDAADYAGITDEVNGSIGFAALEDIEDIAIVLAPAAAADETNHQAIVVEMQKHCRKMRYRVGIVDAREGMSVGEVREFRSEFDDSRLALYYPWVVASDPSGQRTTINVPPAGFIAGVYANTDVQRGVHKAPANEPVIGALGFAQDINRFQQELLNPEGINCLRSFPGRGHRVWGGRTLASDPEWKYVNVRRYFLYLERSIEKSTQWVVFEPNGERLWSNVRTTVEDFLYNEWFNGRLLGPTPKAAYFVRCDRSTMTQNDLDNGRLVCEIGVAPLKPAEFVIFRIGQKTADA